MNNTGNTDIWLSRAVDFGAAIFIGVFVALSIWLWMNSGDGVVLAAILSGLPVCF